MAFQALVIIAGLVVGWVRKGSIWSIINIRLRWIWLLPIAYILQHLSIKYFTGHTYEVAIVFSYLAILVFCGLNWKVPGMLWALGGTAANFLVMSVNGLRMPAYLEAVKKLDPSAVPLLKAGVVGKSIAMGPGTHLNFLGDIFTVNIWPQSLISIGDIAFSIGLVILIQHAMRIGREGVIRARTEPSV